VAVVVIGTMAANGLILPNGSLLPPLGVPAAAAAAGADDVRNIDIGNIPPVIPLAVVIVGAAPIGNEVARLYCIIPGDGVGVDGDGV
jgi:hypothetical protein